MGAGPDGGVWILADHPSGGAVETNVAVLGLLDRTGRPRAGWPVSLDGWRCGDDAGAPGALPVSADGSIRLVCAQDTTSDGPQHHTAFAFSPDGNVLTGWPVALPGDAVSNSAVVVGNELRILNSEVASTEGQDSTVQAAAWWLTSVSASGDIRVGDRYSVADAGGNFDVRMAANGFGYRLEFIGRPAVKTVITAFDLDGVRPGWPVTVPGLASHPIFGPNGLLVVARLLKGGAATARTILISSDGGAPVAVSGDLPLNPLDEATLAGSIPIGPVTATDGSMYVLGTVDATTSGVVHIGPGSAVGRIVPLAKPLQPQGSCGPQDTGCGTLRSLPVAAADGTLYVPESAVNAGGVPSSTGGSLVALAPNGSTPAGWPITLPDRMAGFWSLIARSEGEIDGLVVVPTDRGNQWSLVIIGADGKTRGSTVVIQP